MARRTKRVGRRKASKRASRTLRSRAGTRKMARMERVGGRGSRKRGGARKARRNARRG